MGFTWNNRDSSSFDKRSIYARAAGIGRAFVCRWMKMETGRTQRRCHEITCWLFVVRIQKVQESVCVCRPKRGIPTPPNPQSVWSSDNAGGYYMPMKGESKLIYGDGKSVSTTTLRCDSGGWAKTLCVKGFQLCCWKPHFTADRRYFSGMLLQRNC